MSNRLISIIVVVAGKSNYLKACLDSLRNQSYPRIEVIVVDNSLKEGFGQMISSEFPEVKVLSSQENLFYCASLNKGIQVSKGDFIVCLNDDVVLNKNYLEIAIKGFDVNDGVGMVSGKIVRFDKITIDSAGLTLSFWRTAKEKGYGQKDRLKFNKKGYIFGVNGAAAFYRREMLENIRIEGEYFDSDFRFFYEDLDVAWRANNSGWKCYYVPGAIAYHARGSTARANPGEGRGIARRGITDELLVDLMKNRYLAIIKNESAAGLFLHLPFIIFYDLFAWGYMFVFRTRTIKQLFHKAALLRGALRKRRLIRKSRL